MWTARASCEQLGDSRWGRSTPGAGRRARRRSLSEKTNRTPIMLGKRGSVMLFLKGLPDQITRRELKAFVQGALKDSGRRLLTSKPTVCNCAILRITDPERGNSELHGLVEVQPAKAAMLAIEELDDTELKGARIGVRRYQHRSPLRDRRKSPSNVDGPDSRQDERRRKNLRIELVDN